MFPMGLRGGQRICRVNEGQIIKKTTSCLMERLDYARFKEMCKDFARLKYLRPYYTRFKELCKDYARLKFLRPNYARFKELCPNYARLK